MKLNFTAFFLISLVLFGLLIQGYSLTNLDGFFKSLEIYTSFYRIGFQKKSVQIISTTLFNFH